MKKLDFKFFHWPLCQPQWGWELIETVFKTVCFERLSCHYGNNYKLTQYCFFLFHSYTQSRTNQQQSESFCSVLLHFQLKEDIVEQDVTVKKFYHNKTNCLTFSTDCILTLCINCGNIVPYNLLGGLEKSFIQCVWLCVGILEQMMLQMAE